MAEKLFNVGIKGIIRRGDKVLILQNTKGFWEVPGGRIDDDESTSQALMRELNEELPNIKNPQIGAILDAARLHKDIKDNVSLLLVFFQVEAEFDGEPKLSSEHTAYLWATREEALEKVYDTCKVAIQTSFK